MRGNDFARTDELVAMAMIFASTGEIVSMAMILRRSAGLGAPAAQWRRAFT
jgi:hypothetical protein